MAILFGVSDLLALLDRIPAWKALIGMPARMDALERRVRALEARKARASDACPLCGEEMKTTSVKPHPLFGPMGVERHALKCSSCDHTETRQVDPRNG